MTYNSIGYIVFGLVIYFVTIHVGFVFHRNGKVYLERLFHEDHHLVDSINNLLLVGYYLLNLGFSSISIILWPEIKSTAELFECLGEHMGIIILGLGIMHFFNMTVLLIYSHFKYKNQENQMSN